jgi:ketosteroid isomerase-like protein
MNTLEELMQFGKQWDQAIVDNDAEKVSKFMSSDWVIVGTEGGITSKASFLDSIRSGDLVHNKMDFEDIRVKLYGNTGVVTSRGNQ